MVAAKTSSVRLAPNVANLPLRPPSVLARSVASLDILSNGRVELGLGAGAFWDAIEAIGGRRLTPGQSVDALSEAIDVIRAIWHGTTVRIDGEHHRVHGAKPGPKPAHPVEIWLGAYKPRMLRLTGAKADGWLPSMSYLDLAECRRHERADRRRGGRRRPLPGGDPAAAQRRISSGTGSSRAARLGEQLAELTLSTASSTYVMSVGSADDVRRFAQETAPRVRELVAAGRGDAAAATPDAAPPDAAPSRSRRRRTTARA